MRGDTKMDAKGRAPKARGWHALHQSPDLTRDGGPGFSPKREGRRALHQTPLHQAPGLMTSNPWFDDSGGRGGLYVNGGAGCT